MQIRVSLRIIYYASIRKWYNIEFILDEDVVTKEIESCRGLIDKLSSNEDKVVLAKLLDSCYKYSFAMNNHAQTHPFPAESLIVALLLTQHKLIEHLKLMILSKHSDNKYEDS